MPHIRMMGVNPIGRATGPVIPNNFYFVGDSLTALGSSTMPAQLMVYYPGRTSVLNAIGGIGSADILTRLQADAGVHAGWINILWAGRNDVHNANYVSTNGADTIANVASMVAICTSTTRVIEVTPSADGAENIGSGRYIARTHVNTTFAAAYTGPRVQYVSVVAALQAAGDGSTQDNLDIANGMIPTSLRAPSDATHLNSAGYAIVAARLYASLGAAP